MKDTINLSVLVPQIQKKYLSRFNTKTTSAKGTHIQFKFNLRFRD
jgi:hypothetical protein